MKIASVAGILAHWILISVGGYFVLSASVLRAEEDAQVLKLLAPVAYSKEVPTARPGVFETQFRIDTHESNLTRRAVIERVIRLKVGAKERLVFKFDLASWPKPLRPAARVWIAIGAPATITSEGPLHVGFSQDGVGVSTGLDNTFNREGVILMGCDYAVRDGSVTVEVDNLNHLGEVPCTLHVIVYVPQKLDAGDSVEK